MNTKKTKYKYVWVIDGWDEEKGKIILRVFNTKEGAEEYFDKWFVNRPEYGKTIHVGISKEPIYGARENKEKLVGWGPMPINHARHCVVMGIYGEKNGLSEEHPLDLRYKKELVISDLDYFLEHLPNIVEAVKKMIEKRDAGDEDSSLRA